MILRGHGNGRLSWIALILAIACAGVLLPIYPTRAEPQSKDDAVEELVFAELRRERSINLLDFTINVKSVKDRTLVDPVFVKRDPKTKSIIVARAEDAKLRIDPQKKQMQLEVRRCWVTSTSGDSYFVESKVWAVDLRPEFLEWIRSQGANQKNAGARLKK